MNPQIGEIWKYSGSMKYFTFHMLIIGERDNKEYMNKNMKAYIFNSDWPTYPVGKILSFRRDELSESSYWIKLS